jgi:hypothetical protein
LDLASSECLPQAEVGPHSKGHRPQTWVPRDVEAALATGGITIRRSGLNVEEFVGFEMGAEGGEGPGDLAGDGVQRWVVTERLLGRPLSPCVGIGSDELCLLWTPRQLVDAVTIALAEPAERREQGREE